VWGERFASAGTVAVTVKLGGTFKTAVIYDATVGTGPVDTLKNVDAVPLKLDTNPVIIEL
jgi:hypothetical protein